MQCVHIIRYYYACWQLYEWHIHNSGRNNYIIIVLFRLGLELTSFRMVNASVRASPSSPIPLANSLSRCSRKCCQTARERTDFNQKSAQYKTHTLAACQTDHNSHPCWFCRLGPRCHSDRAPRSGSPGCTEGIWMSYCMTSPTLNTVYLSIASISEAQLKLTAIMLKKSSSPSVSSMEDTVCLAMVSLSPFMLPLTSTKMTTSLGEVAAWMYLKYKS